MELTVILPERIVRRAKELGLDLESLVLDVVVWRLSLDPKEEIDVHLEIAERFLKEGKRLIEEDPTQASEKLYKSAEECTKALAIHFRLDDVLSKVRERGRWTVTDLEKVIRRAVKELGSEVESWWDTANYLHVWGFHEAKLDSEAVRSRLKYVEKLLSTVKKVVTK